MVLGCQIGGRWYGRGSRFRESATESEVPQGTPATATVSQTRLVPPLEHTVGLQRCWVLRPLPSRTLWWIRRGRRVLRSPGASDFSLEQFLIFLFLSVSKKKWDQERDPSKLWPRSCDASRKSMSTMRIQIASRNASAQFGRALQNDAQTQPIVTRIMLCVLNRFLLKFRL